MVFWRVPAHHICFPIPALAQEVFHFSVQKHRLFFSPIFFLTTSFCPSSQSAWCHPDQEKAQV